jgi:hypothetical protein
VRVGLLWRAEWDPPAPGAAIASASKLRGMFDAFAAIGVAAEPVVYSDDAAAAVRDQLLGLDAVLVWVNPIEQGLDRSTLDPLLLEAAEAGVSVSAHPDVIMAMGTKDVLVATRSMSWGTDTRVYRSLDELRRELPVRLEPGSPLVLKQRRGMGGGGVWKVEASGSGSVLVQHAAEAAPPELTPLDEFLDRCGPYFDGGGLMVEQPFQQRLVDGMIRAYLTHDRVVGFTHQYPRGLLPPGVEPGPSGKVFEQPDEPRYRDLRERLEREWVPELQRILGLETASLPVIWDADFFFGPEPGTYVLCEINVSSTFAFPEFAMPGVAAATVERV